MENYVTFSEQDRVRATTTLAGTFPDDEPELSVDPYDSRVSYNVPRGTLGTVTLARTWSTPFPYRVLFDNGQEISMATRDLERVAQG